MYLQVICIGSGAVLGGIITYTENYNYWAIKHKNQSLQRVNLRKYTNSLFICKDKNEDMFDNQAKISVKFNVKGHRTFAIAYSKAESKPQYDTDLPEILLAMEIDISYF